MSSLEELLISEVWPDLQVHTLGEDGKPFPMGRMASTWSAQGIERKWIDFLEAERPFREQRHPRNSNCSQNLIPPAPPQFQLVQELIPSKSIYSQTLHQWSPDPWWSLVPESINRGVKGLPLRTNPRFRIQLHHPGDKWPWKSQVSLSAKWR